MLMMDMPLPQSCENCPCSYWVQTGPNAGQLICEAMESNGKKDIVVDWGRSKKRPPKCPIIKEL